VVGCSVAYRLAQSGLGVTLLERGQLGSQSTGRCAGGVRKQFSSETNVRIQQLSFRMLQQFSEETGLPCGFRPIGYLLLLTTEEQVASFRQQLSMWHRLGVREARWVGPAEAKELAPALKVEDLLGGTFCPTDGIASPNDVTQGYAAAARRLGARIEEGVEVTGIRVGGGRITGVETSAGPVSCPTVVVCAGAWSPALVELLGFRLPVAPYRRHIFVTGATSAVGPETPMTVDVATSFYFHPDGGGALFGMGEADEQPGFELDVDWSILERIEPVIRRRIPALLDAEVRTGWAGLYEVTPDHHPFVGALPGPDGLWCACGFSGHGFQQAPAIGLVLAQMMTGTPPTVDLSAFSPTRDLALSSPEEDFI
jgi:sarcosine oxidase subunit beta